MHNQCYINGNWAEFHLVDPYLIIKKLIVWLYEIYIHYQVPEHFINLN